MKTRGIVLGVSIAVVVLVGVAFALLGSSGGPARGRGDVEEARPPAVSASLQGTAEEVARRELAATTAAPLAEGAPRAWAELRVSGVPAGVDVLPASWVRPSERGVFGFLASERRPLAVEGGEAHGRFEVAADVPVHFFLDVGPVLVSTSDRKVVLAAGETREVRVDLSGTCEVSGRVVGLPPDPALSLTIRYVERRRLGSRGVPTSHAPWTTAQLEADGSFRFPGVPEGSCRLELRTLPRPTDLVDQATGSRALPTCGAAPLLLVPVEPVLGVRPVDGAGRPRLGERFSVCVQGKPVLDPYAPEGGVQWVRLEDVRDAAWLAVHALGRGYFRVDVRDLALEPGGVVDVPVPDGPPPGGSVLVRTGAPLPEGLRLHFSARDEGGSSDLIAWQVPTLEKDPTGLSLLRLDHGARLRGLPPGHYDLQWIWDAGGRRPFAADVEVREGQETVVETELPLLRERKGRVARWDEIPAELRPERLSLGGCMADLWTGEFTVTVPDPLPASAWVRGPGTYVWPERLPVAEMPDGTLLLEVPFETLELVELSVESLEGGRLVAELHQPYEATWPIAFAWERAYVRGTEDGGAPRIPVAEGRTRTGWVRELVDGGRVHLLRGWWELGRGAPPRPEDFDGRWVTVVFDEPGRLVEVRAEGPELAGPALPPVTVATVDSTWAAELWLPDRTRALWLVTEDGTERRIELGAPAGLLELSLR